MSLFTLALLVVALPVVATAVGVLAVRTGLRHVVREGHNDVLVPLFLTAGTIYAVMLGFLVVTVWESYGAAKENVALEASTLATMYRQTNGMPVAERATMRDHIRLYTEEVIDDEWPRQSATGAASKKARHEVGAIYREYSTMTASIANSAVNQEFLHNLSIAAASRNERLLQAAEYVMWPLWLGLVGGAVIVVLMACCLYMEMKWPHVLMASTMTLMISMLLFVTVILSRPFQGDLALQAEPFEHSIGVYADVDKGN